MNYAKLFQNGRSQAVRLPREYRFDAPDKEVIIKKLGNAVVLIPKSGLRDLFLGSLAKFPEDFNISRDPAPPQRDIKL